MSLKGSNDDRLVMSKRLSRRTRQRTSDYRRALSYARKQKTMRQFDASRFVGLRQLGKGGFGLVSLARDIETGEHVVIKGLPKLSPKSGRAWFDNIGTELVMAQKLKPLCGQIVPCMRGIFDTEHAYFMVSEYLGADMIPLDRLIATTNIESAKIAVISNALLDGLRHIHHRGVAHRDIKPENILIDQRDYRLITFIDLGLGCWEGECEHKFTTGTYQYAAPELILRSHKQWTLADFQDADAYALGLTIMEIKFRRRIKERWFHDRKIDKSNPDKFILFARDFNLETPPHTKDMQEYHDFCNRLLQVNGPNLFQLLSTTPNNRM